MPGPRTLRLVWSPAARNDLIRLRDFISQHNPDVARRAAEALKQAANLLLEHPGIGPRVEDREYRELFILFWQRGNVLRYRLDEETIVKLRLWHGLENRA